MILLCSRHSHLFLIASLLLVPLAFCTVGNFSTTRRSDSKVGERQRRFFDRKMDEDDAGNGEPLLKDRDVAPNALMILAVFGSTAVALALLGALILYVRWHRKKAAARKADQRKTHQHEQQLDKDNSTRLLTAYDTLHKQSSLMPTQQTTQSMSLSADSLSPSPMASFPADNSIEMPSSLRSLTDEAYPPPKSKAVGSANVPNLRNTSTAKSKFIMSEEMKEDQRSEYPPYVSIPPSTTTKSKETKTTTTKTSGEHSGDEGTTGSGERGLMVPTSATTTKSKEATKTTTTSEEKSGEKEGTTRSGEWGRDYSW